MDNSTFMATDQMDEATELMEIPAAKAGAVIGRGGETIKRLQERFCVSMKMSQESTCPSGKKTLCIVGSATNVENAKKSVLEIVETTPERVPMQPRSSPVAVIEAVVPRSAAGVIIGKQGDTIKRLQAETDTKIQFKSDEDPNSSERILVIRGSEENIRMATSKVADLVARSANSTMTQMGSQMGPQIEHVRMAVPASKAGLIVGKGGETIRQIQAETGAWLGMSREPFPNPEERIVDIKGTPEQISMVQHIIRLKVGEIMPGTPLVHQPFVPQVHVAANNARTNQPDYSAQWVLYYRSLGMHDQADAIEAEMRKQQMSSYYMG